MKRCLAVSVVVLTFLVAAPRAIPSDDEALGCGECNGGSVRRFVESSRRRRVRSELLA